MDSIFRWGVEEEVASPCWDGQKTVFNADLGSEVFVLGWGVTHPSECLVE